MISSWLTALVGGKLARAAAGAPAGALAPGVVVLGIFATAVMVLARRSSMRSTRLVASLSLLRMLLQLSDLACGFVELVGQVFTYCGVGCA
jgi:hypothetical protein